MRYDFASDNTAAVCPEAWQALQEANTGFASPYGDDSWTGRAIAAVRDVFETDCEVFFTFNGTAANALGLAAACEPFQSVLCHERAHIHRDECGAPEFFTAGAKLEPLAGEHGKLAPTTLEAAISARRAGHASKPGAISLTQATELGTVYQPAEIGAIGEICRRHNLVLQMDGARFANAVAALDRPPRALTWEAGVDVLALGGTKNGLGIGEVVVFFRRELARDFGLRLKQGGQLGAKMRFLTAPWFAVLRDGIWLRLAAHANAMARQLATGLTALRGVELLAPVEANGVFVTLPSTLAAGLHARGWKFHRVLGEHGYRLMCSWQLTRATIEALLHDARACAS